MMSGLAIKALGKEEEGGGILVIMVFIFPSSY